MDGAHGAGTARPQHRQDGEFGVGRSRQTFLRHRQDSLQLNARTSTYEFLRSCQRQLSWPLMESPRGPESTESMAAHDFSIHPPPGPSRSVARMNAISQLTPPDPSAARRQHPSFDPPGPVRIATATGADRETIYRFRHEVYAREILQHPSNPAGRLRDSLDDFNAYVVATVAGQIVGFI